MKGLWQMTQLEQLGGEVVWVLNELGGSWLRWV